MELDKWWPWYERIANLFGYCREKDQEAADLLSNLLRGKAIDLEDLRSTIRGHPAMVFGAGPSLESNLKGIFKEDILEEFVTVAADGATTALLKIARTAPGLIVTDLDGRIRDLLAAHRMGSVMVVHGHGDNIKLLKNHVPKLTAAFGTTQVEPRPNVYNFGGFTDGDRAVFLAEALGARPIVLVGMDFGRVIGQYSKRRMRSLEVKRSKLRMGKELLEFLASQTDIGLYNATGVGERILGFKDIALSELYALTS